MTSSAKYDDVIKNFKTSYIFLDPCLMYDKTAKFGGIDLLRQLLLHNGREIEVHLMQLAPRVSKPFFGNGV